MIQHSNEILKKKTYKKKNRYHHSLSSLLGAELVVVTNYLAECHICGAWVWIYMDMDMDDLNIIHGLPMSNTNHITIALRW